MLVINVRTSMTTDTCDEDGIGKFYERKKIDLDGANSWAEDQLTKINKDNLAMYNYVMPHMTKNYGVLMEGVTKGIDECSKIVDDLKPANTKLADNMEKLNKRLAELN